jgi:hypothetical protein
MKRTPPSSGRAKSDENGAVAVSWPRRSFVVHRLVTPLNFLPDAISCTSDAVGGVSSWNKNWMWPRRWSYNAPVRRSPRLTCWCLPEVAADRCNTAVRPGMLFLGGGGSRQSRRRPVKRNFVGAACQHSGSHCGGGQRRCCAEDSPGIAGIRKREEKVGKWRRRER